MVFINAARSASGSRDGVKRRDACGPERECRRGRSLRRTVSRRGCHGRRRMDHCGRSIRSADYDASRSSIISTLAASMSTSSATDTSVVAGLAFSTPSRTIMRVVSCERGGFFFFAWRSFFLLVCVEADVSSLPSRRSSENPFELSRAPAACQISDVTLARIAEETSHSARRTRSFQNYGF